MNAMIMTTTKLRFPRLLNDRRQRFSLWIDMILPPFSRTLNILPHLASFHQLLKSRVIGKFGVVSESPVLREMQFSPRLDREPNVSNFRGGTHE
jgi:hypothetical protein